MSADKRKFALKNIFLACLFLAFAHSARAEDGVVVINPYVIDEKAKAAEQIERIIKIKNNTDKKVDLYPMVNDVSVEGGKQEFIAPGELDKTLSLARWIRIKRGVIQLMPGAETEVPFSIEVNSAAIPGKRYAVVSFPGGANTDIAAENMKKNAVPSLLINLEIEDLSVERIQLIGFRADKNTFFGRSASFSLNLENIGTLASAPVGKVDIYNRRDQYLGQIDINSASVFIAPGEKAVWPISWESGKVIGKFKARLALEYGNKNKRDLADTAYFWILPLPFVIIFVTVLFFSVAFLVYYLFWRTYVHHLHAPAEEDEKEAVINLKKK